MPAQRRLEAREPWVELRSTSADWKRAEPSLLLTMLGELHLIRAFEEGVLKLASEGLVNGPAHSSIGQEGGAVGSIAGLRATDAINGSHRSHHQFLAKGLSYVAEGELSLDALVTPAIETVLQRTLAEILGLDQGYGRGRGGSIHLQWLEAGALGSNAIVGGGVPLAIGNAWAQRHAGTTDTTLTYFGDGAVNIGSVLESFNLAAAWRLPRLLLHREQPVRRVHEERRGHSGATFVGPRPRFRDPFLARGRDGPARRPPGHPAGTRVDARGRRAHDH